MLTVTTECVGKADKIARGAECLDQSAVVISTSVIYVVSNQMILGIPIVALWGSQMGRKAKLRLSVIFAVGSVKILASSQTSNPTCWKLTVTLEVFSQCCQARIPDTSGRSFKKSDCCCHGLVNAEIYNIFPERNG